MNSITPASTIYSDFFEWLVFGFVFGFVLGFSNLFLNGFLNVFGLVFGFVAGFGVGLGWVWLRYTCGIACAAAIGELPVGVDAYPSGALARGSCAARVPLTSSDT